MQDLFTSFSLQVNNRVYIKNPESSALGRKIVESSINLIDEVGFEAFTFRKLGLEIHSNEASIYRYFESKYKLLLYLTLALLLLLLAVTLLLYSQQQTLLTL